MKHDDVNTGMLLDELPHGGELDTSAAWNRLRVRMNEPETRKRLRWSPLGTWSLAAAGAVAIAAAVVITVSPIRAWAENLLAIFRVEHVAVLDLSSVPANGFENDQLFNQAMTRFISEQVTVTQPPQKPQLVPDAATASNLAGFNAHLLGGETPAALMVRSTITAQLKLDRDRMQSIVDESGRSDLHIPASVDGAVIGLRVPAGIMAFYGNCGDAAARMTGTRQPNAASLPEDESCVTLEEMPSPTASAPSELNPAELAQVALQFAGLSAPQAANFTQTVDWTTTFVLPVLHGEMSYEKVAVNGIDAVLLRAKMRAPTHFVLVWIDNGIMYNLNGTGDNIAALNLASTIE